MPNAERFSHPPDRSDRTLCRSELQLEYMLEMTAQSAKTACSDAEIVSASPLFDGVWYLKRYADVRAAGVDALRHFCNNGWREGRDPGPNFSLRGYLVANPDVARANINPLVHYERYGRKEGRAPLPNQKTKQQSTGPDRYPNLTPETNYLYVRQLVELSGLWDERWYLSEYHRAYTSAREHDGFDGAPLDFFLRVGWTMGHRPCEAFRSIVPAVKGVNPVVALLTQRRFEGYQFVDNEVVPVSETGA